MEKFFKFEIIALIVLFMAMGMSMRAEQYTIVFLNTPGINVGGKYLKQGDSFDNKENIYWSKNDKQLMKVKDERGKMYKITRRAFLSYEKKGVSIKSLSDFLMHEQYLGTRDERIQKHYTEQEFYLVDSLHFQTFGEKLADTNEEAFWLNGDEVVVSPIKRTSDGRFFVVDLGIFKDYEPRDVKLGIRERNDNLNWVNNVYQGINIIFIPKSLKK